MTTIRQLIQTSPAKANDLLTKLADTSDNAVKTRERLFGELKAELELLASLEEEHLFPVLKKHKDLKGLVADALADNRETRKLLAELEQTPKESEEFGTKIVELKKVFQQHVRDDKKEFLPAILKALSDEEAQAIVERIETEKAEIEESRRAEAEERRQEARRAREQANEVQRSADAMIDDASSITRGVLHTAQNAIEHQVGAVSTWAERSTEQALQMFGHSGLQRQDLTRQSSQSLAAIGEAGLIFAQGIQELSREWLDLVQERVTKNLDGFNALARCRSLPDLMAAQGELLRTNLQQNVDSTRKLSEMSARVTNEATRMMARRMDAAQRQAI
jgi:phasin family protein